MKSIGKIIDLIFAVLYCNAVRVVSNPGVFASV